MATLLLIALAFWLAPPLLDWAIFNSIAAPDNAACRAAMHGTAHAGACWGVVTEKYRLILFGRFPFDSQWRPLIATVLMLAAIAVSTLPAFGHRLRAAHFLTLWFVVFSCTFTLLGGGVFGLAPVETSRWGGLPLTLLLTTLGVGLAFPIAILAALGRLSRMPALRTLCIGYIELIRGVPLISVLFMASFLFPLFLPPGWTPDVLLRVLAGIAFFAGAYLAETIRGGLRAIPAGQQEAAESLGLSYWQIQRKILLPQALKNTTPSIMNSVISTFKDTSLVTIVSLYELTGALGLALRGDTDWRPFNLEAYLFIAAIYWIGCHAMSVCSGRLERRLAAGAPV